MKYNLIFFGLWSGMLGMVIGLMIESSLRHHSSVVHFLIDMVVLLWAIYNTKKFYKRIKEKI